MGSVRNSRGIALAAAALAAAAVLVGAALGASDATRRGFRVLGHAPNGGGYAADVWGHGGHAYLSSYRGQACPARGVGVYDVGNPRRPRLVSRFADARSVPELEATWTEKTIVRRVATPRFTGDLAVTSIQACRTGSFQGFALYDVTQPRRPRLLDLVPTEPRGSHEIWLQPVGDRAYVYTAIIASELRSAPSRQTPGRPDFRIFDVSDPQRPRQVGEWGAWRELGIRPDGGSSSARRANFVHSVITNAAGTRAFLSYWDLGTVILDIADPARPRYLGRTSFRRGEDGNAHSAWLGRGERLLVETHETGGGRPTLWDVSNPRRPVRLSELALPRRVLTGARGGAAARVSRLDIADSVHDPKLLGNLAFFSWYRQGVVAADVTNPRRPRFLARFLPPASRDPDRVFCPRSSCAAVWGVFPTRDYVLASDMVGGLWVLRFR